MLNCPECKEKLYIDLDITGGCSGHSDGDLCYCDSLDMDVSFFCGNKTNKKCRNVIIKPKGLRDRYGVAGWINSHISEIDL